MSHHWWQKAILSKWVCSVLMASPSKKKNHQNFLINALVRWAITKTRHSLRETYIRLEWQTDQRMVWRQKFLIMEIANGFKQKITDFQTANEGMSNKFRNYEFMQGISLERVKLARIFSQSKFRIGYYATTSTDSSVFIIGGFTGRSELSTVAEYKNGEWKKVGDLIQPRSSSVAFIVGSSIKIMGGLYGGGTSTSRTWLSTNTEIMDMTSGDSQLIEPILSSQWLMFGMFRVESEYCTKN